MRLCPIKKQKSSFVFIFTENINISQTLVLKHKFVCFDYYVDNEILGCSSNSIHFKQFSFYQITIGHPLFVW